MRRLARSVTLALALLAGPLLTAPLVAGAGAASAQTAAGPSPVKRVLPQSRDGDSFSYLVTCRDGTRKSMVQKLESGQLCVYLPGAPVRCEAGWPLHDAARAACSG